MISTERDLEPCPFCGSRNVSLSAFDVQCDDCGALVVPKRGSDHEAGAIAAWNQRADALASIRAERDAAVAALRGVIAVADRNTVEFDRARAIIEGRQS